MQKILTMAALASLIWCAGPGVADAGINFGSAQTTAVVLPEGVSPAALLLVDAEGEVFLQSSSNSQGATFIPVELGQGGGQPLFYTFEGASVALTSVIFGPEGDLLLRGNSQPEQGDAVGFTARVARDGQVGWEVSDAAFYDDPEYIGAYVQATGPLVWSPLAQRVMIFTESSFEVAPVSQATMLFEFNGDVRDPSVLFGEEYIGASLNSALTTPDGKYLVYYYSQNDRGTRFFLYNGVSSISYFEPEGGDWMNRVVYQVQYDPSGNLLLLWSELDQEADVTQARLTKLDPEGKLLWEEDFDMLRPVFMVAAQEEVVLVRQVGNTYFFDVREGEDGQPVGFYDFFALTENQIYDIKYLPGSDRNYLLSTVNPDDASQTEVLQVELLINDLPVSIGGNTNNDVDPGQGDGLPQEPEGDLVPTKPPEVGCGCSTPASPDTGRGLGWLGAASLLAFWWRRR
jgi:MYXO-CTERM domain-containing protein